MKYILIILILIQNGIASDKACYKIKANDECSLTSIGQMGYTLQDISFANMTDLDLQKIQDALTKHGVIAIKNQKLTRQEQVDLTKKLGKIMLLPNFLRVKDLEPNFEKEIESNKLRCKRKFKTKGKIKWTVLAQRW